MPLKIKLFTKKKKHLFSNVKHTLLIKKKNTSLISVNMKHVSLYNVFKNYHSHLTYVCSFSESLSHTHKKEKMECIYIPSC